VYMYVSDFRWRCRVNARLGGRRIACALAGQKRGARQSSLWLQSGDMSRCHGSEARHLNHQRHPTRIRAGLRTVAANKAGGSNITLRVLRLRSSRRAPQLARKAVFARIEIRPSGPITISKTTHYPNGQYSQLL